MTKIFAGIMLIAFLPTLSATPVSGEISCDRGVDMARVQALVKRTVPALQ